MDGGSPGTIQLNRDQSYTRTFGDTEPPERGTYSVDDSTLTLRSERGESRYAFDLRNDDTLELSMKLSRAREEE